MESKKCNKCGRILPLSEYHKNCSTRDGHTTICKKCTSKSSKSYYSSNSEKIRKRAKRYVDDDPMRNYENRRRTYERNPSKKNASSLLQAAVKAGIVIKPDTCSGCGCTDKERRLEAHHHDYSKPLEVIWLCTKCHRAMDEMRRVQEGNLADPAKASTAKPVIGTNEDGFELNFASQNEAYKAGFKNVRYCLSHQGVPCGGFYWRHANA